jgi:hypothetical protein
VSTCVQQHLISELHLKEYICNEYSKCPPRDSMHASTHHGLPHPFRDAGVVADSLTGIQNVVVKYLFMSTGAAYTRVFSVPTGRNPEDSSQASMEAMQWALPYLSPSHDRCY